MEVMKTKAEIISFIKNRLAELMNTEAGLIDDNAYFVEDIGATSIMIVDMFVSMEEEFGVDMQSKLDLMESLTVSMLADKVLGILEET